MSQLIDLQNPESLLPPNYLTDSLKNLEVVASSTTLVELLRKKALEKPEEAFYIVDLACVAKKYYHWRALLPRVEPFYSMKCNPDPEMVKLLAKLGTGFDCASKREIELVLRSGGRADNIVFANPCKANTQIIFAKEANVKMTTFDNPEELDSIRRGYPEASVILRILPDDSKSMRQLGTKFGASLTESITLISLCKELKMNLVGVSFHVGGACYSTAAFTDAINRAKKIFDYALEFGFKMTVLDIGGGWPGDDTHAPNFTHMATEINPQIEANFGPHVRVIAEPGRYFAQECHTLALSVISYKEIFKPSNDSRDLIDFNSTNVDVVKLSQELASKPGVTDHYRVYVNDGTYHSFNNLHYDHADVKPKVLKDLKPGEPIYLSEIFGHTLDSADLIKKNVMLPRLEEGDYIYFEHMGAYTRAGMSNFHMLDIPNIIYVWGMKHMEQALTPPAPLNTALNKQVTTASTKKSKKTSTPSSPKNETKGHSSPKNANASDGFKRSKGCVIF